MSIYTTEIASDKLVSDNPIHQRLLKPYYLARTHVKGDLLEIGCGEGRGIELLSPLSKTYLALDKNTHVIEQLGKQYANVTFKQAVIPPLEGLADDTFDIVVSFQVIEHIEDDKLFLQEIHRVLKPGGKAILTTPNIKMTLTRNPWHIREYMAKELETLLNFIFNEAEVMGITGNEKVMAYYEENKRSVEKITRYDLFNLQQRLPKWLLRIPYDLLNRLNRNNLKKGNNQLVSNIAYNDYILSDNPDESLDLFCVVRK